MATKKKKTTSVQPLHHTLREFLLAMNYWGSWTRALLFFVTVSLMVALSLSGAEISSSTQGMWFTTLSISSVLLYSLLFFMYDAAYVTLVRRSALHRQLDRLALFVAEAIAVIVIFALRFVYVGNIDMTTVYLAVFGALLLLPIRAVLGIVGRRG